ncbi:hypothetical protein GCM10009759_37680 [Kitasatospora saccharophila]|uniref:Uncharacterized protein n=1 Tax=Kitasatospora saccharophila TaxID=407973 RepID=A0ABN2X0C1_9ACTN
MREPGGRPPREGVRGGVPGGVLRGLPELSGDCDGRCFEARPVAVHVHSTETWETLVNPRARTVIWARHSDTRP